MDGNFILSIIFFQGFIFRLNSVGIEDFCSWPWWITLQLTITECQER